MLVWNASSDYIARTIKNVLSCWIIVASFLRRRYYSKMYSPKLISLAVRPTGLAQQTARVCLQPDPTRRRPVFPKKAKTLLSSSTRGHESNPQLLSPLITSHIRSNQNLGFDSFPFSPSSSPIQGSEWWRIWRLLSLRRSTSICNQRASPFSAPHSMSSATACSSPRRLTSSTAFDSLRLK